MKNLIINTGLLLTLLALSISPGNAADKGGLAEKQVVNPSSAKIPHDEDTAEDDEQESAASETTLEEQLKELKLQVDKLRKEGEARKRLEVSQDESSKKAGDILSAAGREYTLLKKGSMSLEYSFNYSYFSGDVIKDAAIVEKRSNHNITNQLFIERGVFDNLSVNLSIPFAYKYNKVGTGAAQEATDFGDVSIGTQMQPLKAGGDMPAMILSAGLTLPSGSSPYKIDPDTTLPTGSGFYSVNCGLSLSKTMDPLIAFGNLSYNYSFPASGLNQHWKDGRNLIGVDPGSSIGLAMGFGYALSYKASLNLSAQANYSNGNKYKFSSTAPSESGSSMSSSFNIGTGWRVTPSRTISLKLGIGLTDSDPDFSFSIRVPFEF